MGDYYEERYKLRDHDFKILEKFEFKYSPVGFKFFNTKPDLDGLKKLDKKIAWCQMLIEAQRGKAFYAESDNQSCIPGLFLPGHEERDPVASGGRIGPAFQIYPEERANRRIYQQLHYLEKGSVHSTGFAPLNKLMFDPDLLILTCDSYDQTERLLRACQYDTGDLIESKMTYVIGCNWLFNYPYVTGKINYITTGLCYGMKLHKIYPAGLQIVSIPWHHLDRVLRNINEMPWTCPGHTDQKEEFYVKAHKKLGVAQII
ncbi:DUF169 domain-containing protein [bacterium]|nr:DUF169 domain-containing protein [bacterium]